jgi:hypothetical protein
MSLDQTHQPGDLLNRHRRRQQQFPPAGQPQTKRLSGSADKHLGEGDALRLGFAAPSLASQARLKIQARAPPVKRMLRAPRLEAPSPNRNPAGLSSGDPFTPEVSLCARRFFHALPPKIGMVAIQMIGLKV